MNNSVILVVNTCGELGLERLAEALEFGVKCAARDDADDVENCVALSPELDPVRVHSALDAMQRLTPPSCKAPVASSSHTNNNNHLIISIKIS